MSAMMAFYRIGLSATKLIVHLAFGVVFSPVPMVIALLSHCQLMGEWISRDISDCVECFTNNDQEEKI
jgi:hypothetical protein